MRQGSSRVFSFSAGPAAIPLPVLEEAQRDLLCLPGAGASVLEISHRSPSFDEILEETEANLRRLLSVPDSHTVLFLQGGARLQFSMLPMNLLRAGHPGAYLVTGTWGRMAHQEAARQGDVRVVWTNEDEGFRRVPEAAEVQIDSSSSFVHMTSNETIQGVQFESCPDVGEVPLVCDASSDFLSRPLAVEDYGLLYACAQKNAGAAGLTIVIASKELIGDERPELSSMLDYAMHASRGSRLNTPPVFAIYLFMLVTRWLEGECGGLESLAELNARKSSALYEVLDESDFYVGHAVTGSRSSMNVTFRLPNAELELEFLEGAAARGLSNLKGHRSVGGIRASIYNAMPLEGVEALRDFMRDFRASRG